MIGTVSTEVQAQRFSDYLLSIRVDAHIEESKSGEWQVWVEHDDHLDVAKVELGQFQGAPDDAKYASAKSDAQRLRIEREKAADRRRKNYTDVRTSAAFSGVHRYATPVAITIIVATIIVQILQMSHGKDELPAIERWLVFDSSVHRWIDASQTQEFDEMPGTPSMFSDIRRGEVWRLITPIFLHFGIFHILFNMMWLWRFGQVIEGLKGSVFFLILVLVLAATSCLIEAAWTEFRSDYSIFGGMSGVNAGLFGYAWMKHKLQPYERISVTGQETGMMIAWIIICSFGFVGNIANAAHWGGLIVGIVIGATPWAMRRIKGMTK